MTAIDVKTRASLYQTLAEVLIEIPDWMSESGEGWPLTRLGQELADYEQNPTIQNAVIRLASVQAEDIDIRRQRYDALFEDDKQKPLPLSESLMRNGQLVGSLTFAVKSIYDTVGLYVADSELPDHASMELAFLSYLANQELQDIHTAKQWRKLRHLFIMHHAGQWLPQLGKMLIATRDCVYMPIGHLLKSVFPESIKRVTAHSKTHRLPNLYPERTCTLCGFCVQTCPTNALTITESPETVTLHLAPQNCIACTRCVKVCMTHALQMQTMESVAQNYPLYQSPVICCIDCGEPFISEAEFSVITAQIGTPAWLSYCPNCRTTLAVE